MQVIEKKDVIYEFGKFVLDPNEKKLLAEGTPIRLPAKEFETLVVLVENNGRALSKEEMIAAIWQDAFVEEGNLAKQISKLRKIFNTNGNQFIETLPKHGYRFSADLRLVSSLAARPVIPEKRTVERTAIESEAPDEMQALPSGLKRTARLPIFAAVALATLIGVTAAWYLNYDTQSPAARISIAVLPLKPLAADENSKVLGLGLTDALITKLGGLRQIVVRPTGAVAPFANSTEDPVDIGRKLSVDAVLEGTIQQSDGRLRINARLIRTDSGIQIWAETFDEPAGGIFAVQDALSTQIAKTLAFELTNDDNKLLARRGTDNADAYEKYLRGRFYQSQNSPEGLKRSIEFYEQAVALDPNFADAHAGIADANIIQFNFGIRPTAETIVQARESVNRALQLDPNLSHAYTSLSLIQFLIDRNWIGAEISLQRAIELHPNNADAYHRYAYFLLCVGRFDESLQKAEKARELNPLSNILQNNIGMAYLFARRYPEAIKQLEKTAAENPRFTLPKRLLGLAYEATGEIEKAFEEELKVLEIEGGKEFAAKLRGQRDAGGIGAANRLWLDEAISAYQTDRLPSTEESQKSNITSFYLASRAATVKDREQTLHWLEQASQQGDPILFCIRFLAKYDFVRDDPRFQAIVQKLQFDS
jgi:TolB-like protein/DNA-binding winged helix-turn-helix (wHTH) protein